MRSSATRCVAPARTGEMPRWPGGVLLEVAELVLILPALVFLTAVVVRYIGDPDRRRLAHARELMRLFVIG